MKNYAFIYKLNFFSNEEKNKWNNEFKTTILELCKSRNNQEIHIETKNLSNFHLTIQFTRQRSKAKFEILYLAPTQNN